MAWVLAQGSHIIALPGTTQLDHLEENAGASGITLSQDMLRRLDALINPRTVSGARYAPAVQAEIDTEEIGVETR
jgi:aryl-alcohol dehydrogenase-like predicted oxidoreductase